MMLAENVGSLLLLSSLFLMLLFGLALAGLFPASRATRLYTSPLRSAPSSCSLIE